MSVSTVRWVATIAVLLSTCASAHVTVWPRESQNGAYEKYVVRVPTEGKVATTSVELTLPEEVTFISVAAAIGHTYELRRAGDRIVGIVWKLRIEPGEFAEFAFMARNPKDGKQIVWKAQQRLADGTSVSWSGPSGDKRPASITRLGGAAVGHTH